MDAAEILHTLTDQGFSVAIKAGALSIVPASRLSPALRAEIRAHKPALVELLTQAANDDAERHHIWLIRAEHEVFSMGFCPPKTRAEVEARYPGAEVEVLEEEGNADE